ncbi:MAG: hypothetical protein SF162_13995 [bacterium]|nr:hypothetical protein [bacterium]
MPIHTTLLEPQIMLELWTGIVTMPEVVTSGEDVRALANEHHFTSYITIIDGTALEQFQFNLREMLTIVEFDKRNVGIYIINGPAMAQIAARAIDKLVKMDIKVCRDLPHARALARAYLGIQSEA